MTKTAVATADAPEPWDEATAVAAYRAGHVDRMSRIARALDRARRLDRTARTR